PGYEPGELPNCSTPRRLVYVKQAGWLKAKKFTVEEVTLGASETKLAVQMELGGEQGLNLEK
ncbi:hypothetical protein, partial [uncultured Varibaculum sp.]|uniref:hypothetical protein n=1 Tax=uncultured Varibaculum sp. TaxID=413896 RepID=UPI002803E447